MNDSVYRLIYTLLPCLVGAFAVAVFLTSRPISAVRAWLLGVVIASALTLGALIVNRPRFGYLQSDVPLYLRLVELFGSLYFIPMIVLVPTALGLRSRGTSRNTGVVILVALFLVSAWVARLVAGRFDLIEAVHVVTTIDSSSLIS